jgi:hypothetical protein
MNMSLIHPFTHLRPPLPPDAAVELVTALQREEWRLNRRSWQVWIAILLCLSSLVAWEPAAFRIVRVQPGDILSAMLLLLCYVTGVSVCWLTAHKIAGPIIRRNSRRVWIAHGLCPTCGYDMRASRNLCPECGSTVPKF